MNQARNQRKAFSKQNSCSGEKHGAVPQKIQLFITTSVRILNLMEIDCGDTYYIKYLRIEFSICFQQNQKSLRDLNIFMAYDKIQSMLFVHVRSANIHLVC
jgi:hypothetical protein